MSTSEIFLIAMGIIFLVPFLIWRLGKTEYFAPLVVVQIITGILLGPGVLGALYPHYYAFVFNPAVVQALNGIAGAVLRWPPEESSLIGWLLLMAVGSTMLTIPLATPKLRRLRTTIS